LEKSDPDDVPLAKKTRRRVPEKMQSLSSSKRKQSKSQSVIQGIQPSKAPNAETIATGGNVLATYDRLVTEILRAEVESSTYLRNIQKFDRLVEHLNIQKVARVVHNNGPSPLDDVLRMPVVNDRHVRCHRNQDGSMPSAPSANEWSMFFTNMKEGPRTRTKAGSGFMGKASITMDRVNEDQATQIGDVMCRMLERFPRYPENGMPELRIRRLLVEVALHHVAPNFQYRTVSIVHQKKLNKKHDYRYVRRRSWNVTTPTTPSTSSADQKGEAFEDR